MTDMFSWVNLKSTFEVDHFRKVAEGDNDSQDEQGCFLSSFFSWAFELCQLQSPFCGAHVDCLEVSVAGCTLSLSVFMFYGIWIGNMENANIVNKSQALTRM